MQLQKNQRISLQITGMTAEGSGVGRVPSDGVESQGLAVFVPYTAVGDEIDCQSHEQSGLRHNGNLTVGVSRPLNGYGAGSVFLSCLW